MYSECSARLPKFEEEFPEMTVVSSTTPMLTTDIRDLELASQAVFVEAEPLWQTRYYCGRPTCPSLLGTRDNWASSHGAGCSHTRFVEKQLLSPHCNAMEQREGKND